MSYDQIIRNALRLAKAPRRFALGGEADPKDISPSISNPVSVFPKPQRMFPADAPVPGGQYLGMPDKEDMTGHKSAVASIGVHPGGKPYFNASKDAVDQTGTAGKAKTKTNLFKQKAGWSWQNAPEGHEDTNTIVSVEHRGKHYYALNAHFPKGVDFARYEKAKSEPRLRPTTTGDVFLGPQAGTISVRGKEHPVYHHVVVKADGGAVGYASGGVPASNPSVNREENFKKWFGNSKAIDGEGKPWVHYHATPKSFSEFIPGGHKPNLSGQAIWLTPDKNRQPAAHNIFERTGEFKEGANVMPLYVKIENPLYYDESDQEGKRELDRKFGSKSSGFPMYIHSDDLKKLKAAGYDGIFHMNSSAKFNPETGEGLETIVFSPYQVKSAIGNSGNFDPNDANITKTGGGAVGYASGGDVDQSRQLDDRGFYSAAAEAARSLPQAKGSPSQMMATMKGVKPSELEWSGAGDAFANQKTVNRDDLAQHFEQNVPKITETVLGGKIDPEILRKRQEIADMYFPEIKRYINMADLRHEDHHPDDLIREAALLRAEEIQDRMREHMDREAPLPDQEPTRYKDWTLGSRYGNETPSQRGYREILLRLDHPDTLHKSSHWDEPNVIAHLRMQDRGMDNDVLHLEEVQSDWAQEGREQGFADSKKEKAYRDAIDGLVNRLRNELMNGEDYKKLKLSKGDDAAKSFLASFIDNWSERDLLEKYPEEIERIKKLRSEFYESASGIEPAPYVTNTDHWTELALKRALIEAARGGYNKLVWTPGEEQAKRYSLGNYADKIKYSPEGETLRGYKNGEMIFAKAGVKQDSLHEHIGMELADEIMQHRNSVEENGRVFHELTGQQLFMGGKGMTEYYGKILPNALRRVLKPHTDKIQPTSHVVKDNDGNDVTLPGIEITPEMRESILKKGFSHYAHGGEVRQHFEVGGGADGGDSGGGDSSNGDGGGFSSDSDMADFGSQTEREDSSPAAPSYSPTDQDPSMLGGATGMAFSPLGSGSLGVGTGQVSGSVLGNVEQNLNTGPGVVGFIGGSPLGALAYAMEQINNTYYDGKARADVDQNVGGPSSGQNPDVVYPQSANPSGGFRLSSDDEETQAGMVKPVAFAPPAPPMMASGGKARNSHPVLSIPGVHIREEIHGRPIFLGDRDG